MEDKMIVADIRDFLASNKIENDDWMNDRGFRTYEDFIIFEPHVMMKPETLKLYKEKLRNLGATKIKVWNPYGQQTYKGSHYVNRVEFIPTEKFVANVETFIAEREAKKVAEKQLFEAKVNAIDLDSIANDHKVMDRVKSLMDKGSRINYKAIKSQEKIDTYFAACILLGWLDMADNMKRYASKAMRERLSREYDYSFLTI